MNAFEYARPTTVSEALGLLSASTEGETALLAGGTDLLSLMKDFVVEPKRLVSLMGVGELKGIRRDGAKTTLGATTTLDELLADAALAAACPALAQAAAGIKSPQLRAMGTIGGELLQRPRCWYFRHGHGLLALDEKGESMVPAGDHRYHAVIENGGLAKFVSASSLAPALIACGATATLLSPRGERTLKIEELFRTPSKAGERETTVALDELLTAIALPKAWPKSATYEVRPRRGLDWPLATASVAFEVAGGKITAASVVLGHVGPRPHVATAAAKELIGQPLEGAGAEKAFAAAAQAALAGATPLKDNGHKVELAMVAVRRALAAAAKA